jgi:hypothetical protein
LGVRDEELLLLPLMIIVVVSSVAKPAAVAGNAVRRSHQAHAILWCCGGDWSW